MKRIAVAMITVVIALTFFQAWRAGNADLRLLFALGFGVMLGIVYLIIGEVPDWLARHTVADDDDAGNISPVVYLPILLLILVVAIAAFVFAL